MSNSKINIVREKSTLEMSRRLTKTAVDTGSNTLGKTFVEALTTGHLAELFLFLRRKLHTEGIETSTSARRRR